MNFLKIFIKDEVPAVGLTKFRDRREETEYFLDQTFGPKKQYFKPDYSQNFFLL